MHSNVNINNLKGLPTTKTSKIMYYNRSCSKCKKCPCFPGFENMKTDFAIAGCIDYVKNDNLYV